MQFIKSLTKIHFFLKFSFILFTKFLFSNNFLDPILMVSLTFNN